MSTELSNVINLLEQDGNYFVSSKEVAERFEKRHRNILRDIENLQVSEKFRLLNFERTSEKDSSGIDRPVIYMTRDGFSILAFGFIGKEAMEWKEAFLAAFNKMEEVVREKIPALEKRVIELELEKRSLMLESPKKPHHLKGKVLVPVSVDTLFGPDIEYRRVPKDYDKYSTLAYEEGELRRLSSCAEGMLKKIAELSKEIALHRRN